MARGDDINNFFDEQRKKLNEDYGLVKLPGDAKGRVITFVVLALIVFTLWYMIDLVIVTFILTFVFSHLQKYAMRGLAKTPFKFLPYPVVQILVYAGVIALFVLFAMQNAPIIMKQIGDIAANFAKFDFQKFVADIDYNLVWLANQIDLNEYIWRLGQAIVNGLASLGSAVLNFFLALFLSFLFVLEEKKIVAISDTLKSSRIAFLYRYVLLFASSFSYTFGKVMKVQVVIAAVNCAISTAYLSITGFPHIMVLSIMIFIFGLIPIAGAFISTIPLIIIGFNYGGIYKVLEVIIMIVIIHAVEAYVLDPKLLSHRTALPVSIVFVALIVSQSYVGIWGMLLGIPFFIFLMNVLGIDYSGALKKEALLRKTAAAERRKGRAPNRPARKKKE